MIGPQVQKALVGSLGTGAIATLGERVFDGVPPGAILPYVVVGEEQTNDSSDQCHAIQELFIDIHVWSERQGSLVEAKTIGEAIRHRLTGQDLQVEDYSVIELQFQTGRVLRDPDGVTAHAVLTFRLLLQPQ